MNIVRCYQNGRTITTMKRTLVQKISDMIFINLFQAMKECRLAVQELSPTLPCKVRIAFLVWSIFYVNFVDIQFLL